MQNFVRPFEQEVRHQIPNYNVGDCGLSRCERAIYFLVTSMDRLTGSIMLTLLRLTCPVAIVGSHYPVSIYSALAANVATYALVGLVVEILRRRLNRSN